MGHGQCSRGDGSQRTDLRGHLVWPCRPTQARAGYLNPVSTREAYFYGLDALVIALALGIWLVVWPPRYIAALGGSEYLMAAAGRRQLERERRRRREGGAACVDRPGGDVVPVHLRGRDAHDPLAALLVLLVISVEG